MSLPLWPRERAGAALVTLANLAGLPQKKVSPPRSVSADATMSELATWMEHAALAVGIEAEPLEAFYPDLDVFLSIAGPALFPIGGQLLALLRCTRKRATVIDTDGRVHHVPTEELRAALLDGSHAAAVAHCSRMLDGLRLSPSRRRRALHELLRRHLGRDVVGTCWALRQQAGAPLRTLARQEGLLGRFVGLVVVRLLEIGASVAGWVLIGRGALEGRFDSGWIWAWALVLFTQIPLRAVAGTLQGRLAIGFGALLKRRLIAGSLQMRREAIAHEGVGALLGRVLEADAIEALASNGGFAAVSALVLALAALAVLALGAAPLAGCAVFVAWLMASMGLAWRMFRARKAWTRGRIGLTHTLVENIVGHRTRVAQGHAHLHEEEDADLTAYAAESKELDRLTLLLRSLVPAGWFLTGLVAVGPAFVRGADTVSLAIAVGGVILGHRALVRLTAAAVELSSAAVAWGRVGSIVSEAKLEETGAPSFVAKASAPPRGDVLELSDVTFRYRSGDTPTLNRVSLSIGRDDRILLEGPSGGGKSTFASLLAGLRQPESGLVLLRGLDHRTLGGHGWRTGVALAPQFHENHVLSSTFAFNLLMARRWPPETSDYAEAEEVCSELGLGPVLGRMPAGMEQAIGESGWQLSHGEKSRLYLARTLLQGGSLVVLDESFAALDPETMRRCVQCARKRAPALLVIAHP